MRRRPELQGLSSEHHQALVLARRAFRAAEQGDEHEVRRVWEEIRGRFQDELADHFAVEERTILPALAEAGDADLVLRTLTEHAQLRALVDRSGEEPRAACARFGALLRGHARFEERALFPAAEAKLTDEALEAIAAAAPHPDAQRTSPSP